MEGISQIRKGIQVATKEIATFTSSEIERLAAAWLAENPGVKPSNAEICLDAAPGFRGVRIYIQKRKK